MFERYIVDPVGKPAEEVPRTDLDQRVAVLVTFLIGVGLVALVLDVERGARRFEVRSVVDDDGFLFLHSFLLCPIGRHAVCEVSDILA